MNKIKVVILANEMKNDHSLWVKACQDYNNSVEFRIADLTKDNWLEEILSENFDFLLAKPGCHINSYKNLYDERLSILKDTYDFNIFPSLLEVKLYENKKFLSYWLKANDLPHPRTHVFYNRYEADKFLKNSEFPLVTKLNIGASANGVQILRSYSQAKKYTKKLFLKGLHPSTGPKLNKGHLIKRISEKLIDRQSLIEKLRLYHSIKKNKQCDFILFQEFISHEYEWRVVKIGKSYFAHKKSKKGLYASGSLIKEYDNPPFGLLNFVKKICDEHNFNSVAVDIFEKNGTGYLINEIQCIFGQSDPYQMKVNGIPGRYIYQDSKWIFEEGMFNNNESYNLRLDHVISVVNNQ